MIKKPIKKVKEHKIYREFIKTSTNNDHYLLYEGIAGIKIDKISKQAFVKIYNIGKYCQSILYKTHILFGHSTIIKKST